LEFDLRSRPIVTESGKDIPPETAGITIINVGYLARTNQYAYSALRQLVNQGESLLFSRYQSLLVDELGLVELKAGQPFINEEVVATMRHFEQHWLEATLGIE